MPNRNRKHLKRASVKSKNVSKKNKLTNTSSKIQRKEPQNNPKPDPELNFLDFVGLDQIEYRINLRQKLFCESYLQFYGNGVDAVIEAGYDVTFKDKNSGTGTGTNRKLAAVIAAQNLVKLNIIAYLNLKLDEYGYNDEDVDKQHRFLINQYENLNAKAKGVDMYLKRRGLYAPEKHEHSFKEFDTLNTDDLIKAAGITVAGSVNGTENPGVSK